MKESSVRRRYSDFEWLRNELERDSKVGVQYYFFNKIVCFFINVFSLNGLFSVCTVQYFPFFFTLYCTCLKVLQFLIDIPLYTFGFLYSFELLFYITHTTEKLPFPVFLLFTFNLNYLLSAKKM